VTQAGQEIGFLEYVRRRNPDLFAHHPDHPAFRDHTWTVGGLRVCKGCSFTYTGMLLGGVAYAATRWLESLSDPQVGLAFAALLAPTLATSLWESPRAARHLARVLLGVLLSSALIEVFVTRSWAVRATILAAYLAARIPLDRKRRRGNLAAMQEWNRKHTSNDREDAS
jgi:hypothetical protein